MDNAPNPPRLFGTIVLSALAFLAMAAVGVAISISLSGGGDRAATSGSLGSTGTALIGGPFTLVDGDGETVTEAVLSSPVNFVYFGFTHCPDFCPTELANLAAARRALAERDIESRTVFITVDPARDTPEVVGRYAQFFDPESVGLTGAQEQVAAAAQAYRVSFSYGEADETGFYAVNHSTLVYAMDDQGRLLSFFTANTSPEEIAATLAEALQARQS